METVSNNSIQVLNALSHTKLHMTVLASSFIQAKQSQHLSSTDFDRFSIRVFLRFVAFYGVFSQ